MPISLDEKRKLHTLVVDADKNLAAFGEGNIRDLEERLDGIPEPKPEPALTVQKFVGQANKMLAAEVVPGYTFPQNTVPYAIGRVKNTLEAAIKEQEAAEPTLTSTEKAGALRSITYAETNLGYLSTQTSRVPSIHARVEQTTARLSDVRGAVEADPPTSRSRARHGSTHKNRRHTSPSVRPQVTASRRGLSPRQRRPQVTASRRGLSPRQRRPQVTASRRGLSPRQRRRS